MFVKVLGKHIEKGVYEGRAWQKIVLSVQVSELSQKYNGVEGIVVDVVRCPYTELFSKIKVGQEISFLYDKYGKIAEFRERR